MSSFGFELEFFSIGTYVAIGLIILWNIATFALYAIDKGRAKANQWRIKEFTLILVAFLMGGVGALLGMNILRHKTQKTIFKVMVPLGVVVNIIVLVGLFLLLFSVI